RRPQPDGQPGFVRVDSVHQGDLDGAKGVYHINVIDAVTQYEVVGSVPRINESFLLPLLEDLINAFPFVIRGLHADNGSEYINYRVAAMLDKLRVTEFTKSRARQTTDNALVESKNAAVVRKHLGYGHIPARWAKALNHFNRNVLSPYLNYHRPCLFAEKYVDAKGKVRKKYPADAIDTPYNKLKALPDAAAYLRPGVTFRQLDAQAYAISDNEAARQLNEAKAELFKSIPPSQKSVA
ncbi:MAG: transposase family protein, partial [Sinobacteraceae bacterium]|nr:transposase family protein [Nevskiaceae bacterium]